MKSDLPHFLPVQPLPRPAPYLSSINPPNRPADIAIVRKLRKPPNLIQRIMDCVLILQRSRILRATYQPETTSLVPSWEDAVRTMGQANFLATLMEFDKDIINEEDCELIEPYLSAPDFTYARAQKVSGNVAGLCSWVSAMNTFYYVNKVKMRKESEFVGWWWVEDRKVKDTEMGMGKSCSCESGYQRSIWAKTTQAQRMGDLIDSLQLINLLALSVRLSFL